MDISFRAVEPQDHASIRRLVDDAFRPEDVVTFLDALWADECILGEWLAQESGELAGHIAFSRVWVQHQNGQRVAAAMLTPLAVSPGRQRHGIGTRLMNHALKSLEARGESVFFVLGHPEYYPRVGFRAEAARKVASPWVGNPAFMARAEPPPQGQLILPTVIADAH